MRPKRRRTPSTRTRSAWARPIFCEPASATPRVGVEVEATTVVVAVDLQVATTLTTNSIPLTTSPGSRG